MEGDVFAIETFGSTGKGRCVEDSEVSHYALYRDATQCRPPSVISQVTVEYHQEEFWYSSLVSALSELDRTG